MWELSTDCQKLRIIYKINLELLFEFKYYQTNIRNCLKKMRGHFLVNAEINQHYTKS